MTKKIRVSTLAVLIAVLLLTLTVSGVFAAPPLTLHIEVAENVFSDPDVFTASGTAVDAGMVCGTGLVSNAEYSSYDGAGSDYRIIHVTKHFECDGGGTFDIFMVVRLNLVTYETTATWRIVSGTGDYAGLQGRGTLEGTPIVPGTSVLDVYDGMVH